MLCVCVGMVVNREAKSYVRLSKSYVRTYDLYFFSCVAAIRFRKSQQEDDKIRLP